MKIIPVKDKKDGVVYNRYKINLPKKEIEECGLLGQELTVKVTSGKIVIEKAKPLKQKKNLK